jgi:1-deoxy-D-xylulose-5-phosphate reductoisomerase
MSRCRCCRKRPQAARRLDVDMAQDLRTVTILGSTGSIGRSALEVIRHYPDRFRVEGLAAGSNTELLREQIREFRPRHVAVADAAAARKLKERAPGLTILEGEAGLCEAASAPADIVLCAMVGAAGLRPLMAAIEAGNRIAVANKEPMVMAGRLIMAEARRREIEVLPVDSEHNAVFQCLLGHRHEDIRSIHLTASGGPFYGRSAASLAAITPEEAAEHPTWDMGRKISVDSATLMNKGLEVIEAMHLFDLPAGAIEVVIHPQSIIHSLVEFRDGHILAHLGVTDMKFPILYALAWPDRAPVPMERLNLAGLSQLSFGAPDFDAFPCLALARQAAETGGTAPAILNAANEEAVAAFCEHRIVFPDISAVVRAALEAMPAVPDRDLETITGADAEARNRAREIIAKRAS